MANTVRSSNARNQPTPNVPKQVGPVDEYALFFRVDGKISPSYCTLDTNRVTKAKEGQEGSGDKPYAFIVGTLTFSMSAVLDLPGSPSELLIVSLSKGTVVEKLGSITAVHDSDNRGDFVSFNGEVSGLPNGINRINNIRVRQADKGGFSVWAMCGHFIVSWAKASPVTRQRANRTATASVLASL